MSCLMEGLSTRTRPERASSYRLPEPTTGRVHVLICSDERWSTEWLRFTLHSQGYNVCGMARDGVEAYNLALTTFPDVVITDLRLPRIDGVALTRLLMETLPTPVLVLAGPNDGLLAHQAVAEGATAVLRKPFPEQHLRPAIDSAMWSFAEREADDWKLPTEGAWLTAGR